MKRYEIVIHRVGNKFTKETYSRDSNGSLIFVDDYEADSIPMNYSEKEIYELNHSHDYEKVKSPFGGRYLYGRYINISQRVKDEINRF
jgi:hypothetical protein